MRDQVENGVTEIRTFDRWGNDGAAAEAVEKFSPGRALLVDGGRTWSVRLAIAAAGIAFRSLINGEIDTLRSTPPAALPAREIRTQQHKCCHADDDGLSSEHGRIG